MPTSPLRLARKAAPLCPRFGRAGTSICAGDTSSGNAGQQRPIDSDQAIRLAAQRLESLLAGTGDGEEEQIDNFIAQLPPDLKLAGMLAAGGILGSFATALCMAINVSPWGGLDLSLDTLGAAGIGALASLPIMRLRNMKWTESDEEFLPALVTLREMVHKDGAYLTEGMSPLQLAIVIWSESFVRCIWDIAMLQDGIRNLVVEWCHVLGVDHPGMLDLVLPIAVVAVMRGIADGAAFSQDPDELEVLQSAVENCDRYYQVMNSDKSSAVEMASAFKAVTYLWCRQKKQAARAAFGFAAIEVVYASIIWRLTGNLAAPIMIFALAKCVDCIGSRTRCKK